MKIRPDSNHTFRILSVLFVKVLIPSFNKVFPIKPYRIFRFLQIPGFQSIVFKDISCQNINLRFSITALYMDMDWQMFFGIEEKTKAKNKQQSWHSYKFFKLSKAKIGIKIYPRK